MTKLSTLCYIEKDDKYLMLHRTVKENDVNKDKWIGVGGHFEYGESPEECLLREVKEETGYTLTSWAYRGIVTFVYGEDVVEYMSLLRLFLPYPLHASCIHRLQLVQSHRQPSSD